MLSVFFDKFIVGIAGHDTWLYTAYAGADGKYEIPFLVNMGLVFFFTVLLMVIISLADAKGRSKANAMEIDKTLYRVDRGNLVLMIIVAFVFAALYIRFW